MLDVMKARLSSISEGFGGFLRRFAGRAFLRPKATFFSERVAKSDETGQTIARD